MVPLTEFFQVVARLAEDLKTVSRTDRKALVVARLATTRITATMTANDRAVVRTARWLVARARRLSAQIEASEGPIWHTATRVRESHIK